MDSRTISPACLNLNVNETKLTQEIQKYKDVFKEKGVPIDKVIQELNSSCPPLPTGGKRLKKKGSKRNYHQKGGNISVTTFKNAIYVLIVLILGYMAATSSETVALQGIIDGLSSAFSNRCASLPNLFLGAIGLGNPVCVAYNSLWRDIINAMNGNAVAIGKLGAILTAILQTPTLLTSGLKLIIYRLALFLPKTGPISLTENDILLLRNEASGIDIAGLTIKNIEDTDKGEENKDNSTDNTHSGGKRKTKSKSKTKSKKSKKSKSTKSKKSKSKKGKKVTKKQKAKK